MSFRWTYVWLAAGGLLLVLAVLAFAYLIGKRHWARFSRLLGHPVLRSADRRLSSRFPRIWGFIRARFSIHQWRGLALTIAAVVLFSTLYAFALVTESWTDEEALYAFDQRIYGWLVDAIDPTVVAVMQVLTHFADSLTILILTVVTGALLLIRKHTWRVVELFLAVGMGAALMWGLKMLFGRGRPTERLLEPAGHSFPSGHSFMAAALYGFLVYLTWRFVRRDSVRIAITIALVMVIFLIGLSRVILRVHWVSDVMGGFTAGLAWLVCSLIVAQAIRHFLAASPEQADELDRPG